MVYVVVLFELETVLFKLVQYTITPFWKQQGYFKSTTLSLPLVVLNYDQ